MKEVKHHKVINVNTKVETCSKTFFDITTKTSRKCTFPSPNTFILVFAKNSHILMEMYANINCIRNLTYKFPNISDVGELFLVSLQTYRQCVQEMLQLNAGDKKTPHGVVPRPVLRECLDIC